MKMTQIKTDGICTLEMYNRHSGNANVFCDLLVVDDKNTVFAANIIGSDTKVKQVAYLLQEGKTGTIHNRSESLVNNNGGHHRHTVYGLSLKKSMYDEEIMKLDDLTQIFMVGKMAKPDIKARTTWVQEEKRREEEGHDPRPLPIDLSELIIAWDGDFKKQVFDVLDDRYNTPMLEEWKDYIVETLIERGHYEPLTVETFGSTYSLEAGILRVTESNLEEIITEAIQGYAFEFAIEEDGRQADEAVLHNIHNIDSYLSHFAGELGARIQQNIGLRFNPESDTHHPAFTDVNGQANRNGITGLFPPQANTVMGVARTVVEDDNCFVIGEMGSGKTPMGIVTPYITEAIIQNVANNPRPKRVIVMSPGIMVEKWAREIKERIPNCETFQITNWKDVKVIQENNQYIDHKGKVKYKKPEQWEYYIMSSEAPKFTYPKEAIKNWRTKKDDITFYATSEVDVNNVRMITRMTKNNDGKYVQMIDSVVNPEHKIQFVAKNFTNMESGRTDTVYSSGDTGYYCPGCGGQLTLRRDGEDEIAGEHFFEKFNKSGRNWLKDMKKENYQCENEVDTNLIPKESIQEWRFDKTLNRRVPAKAIQPCGYVLWQTSKEITIDTTTHAFKSMKPGQKKKAISGLRKVSPAWYINKHLPRGFFKYLIADEVHEYKSGDSSTGRAFGQLVNHTEKQILLTGTLMGGMARDIFYLLARLNPKRLLKEGITYGDEAVFNNRYGITEYSTTSRSGTTRRSPSPKPGISPHMFPMHLMGNCAFLELNDMGYALPPYQEIPVVVPMEPEHFTAYREIAHEIMSTMRSTDGLGGMASISTFINAMYQYADAPFNVSQINTFDVYGQEHILGQPYNFDEDEFVPAKLTELVNNIDKDLYNPDPYVDKDGETKESPKRRSLVYVKYTGDQAWNQMDIYLYKKLKRMGYNVGILRSGSGTYDGIKMPKNSRDREAWLHREMEKNDWDILITNPRLVKVGLDLLMFPNIHFFQLDYSTYDYMQASRRSWRLKQHLPVKVYTYVYGETIQEKALQHIARKIDAAMAMQGKFSEEGLRAMADSADGMNALAKQLMKDDVLDDLETVHDMFARKNQSFEEMQSVEFQDYDGYVMNPEYEMMCQVRDGKLAQVDEMESTGQITTEEAVQARREIVEVAEIFEMIMMTVEDTQDYNKGVAKKKQIVEGQQELDLFALV
jgi:hypothetical protein